MINLELLSIDWINSASQKQRNSDKILVEKPDQEKPPHEIHVKKIKE